MYIEKAPAKINLVLDVIGKRDDGFHDLRMVMTTIDLSDRLLINLIKEDKIILNSNKYFYLVMNVILFIKFVPI